MSREWGDLIARWLRHPHSPFGHPLPDGARGIEAAAAVDSGPRALAVGMLVLAIGFVTTRAAASDDELARHLASIRTQIEDLTQPLDRREDLALETADTLDRAAQSSTDAEVRRTRWSQAVELCDWFVKQYPESPRERQFRFRAGLYSWALARSYSESWQLDPRDRKPRDSAVAALDEAIERFRSIAPPGPADRAFADNLHFRLAESLADRAEFEPAGSQERSSREAEALKLLEQPPSESALGGYWHLLNAELLLRTGNPGLADPELSAAAAAKPPLPESELLEVRVPLFIEQKQFAKAKEAVVASHLQDSQKELWKVRIGLAERPKLPEGKEQLCGRVGAVSRGEGALRQERGRVAAGASGAGQGRHHARFQRPAGSLGITSDGPCHGRRAS